MKMLFAGASFAFLALVACGPTPGGVAPTANIDAATPAPKAVSIAAPAGEYVSDPNHASVSFKLKHLGLSFYTLKFRTYAATVSFDPANIAASKVIATINPADILAGYPSDYVAGHPGSKFKSWEGELANSSNFLDAEQFPAITFASTSTEASGERSAKVTGDLTLKGVTKQITLDVTFSGETASHPFSKLPALGFSASGEFKRSDFGLGYLAGMVGDEVNVQIEGDFIQKTPA
jgi:polyisoprenoid-binding protein YceI